MEFHMVSEWQDLGAVHSPSHKATLPWENTGSFEQFPIISVLKTGLRWSLAQWKSKRDSPLDLRDDEWSFSKAGGQKPSWQD